MIVEIADHVDEICAKDLTKGAYSNSTTQHDINSEYQGRADEVRLSSQIFAELDKVMTIPRMQAFNPRPPQVLFDFLILLVCLFNFMSQ